MQSNPVELAVSVFADRLGQHRVVGAGSYNDSLRFRRELAEGLSREGRCAPVISAYILGEHGVNAVPIWSSAQAAGMVLGEWEAHLARVHTPVPLSELPRKVAAARERLAELVIVGRTSTATAYSAVEVVARLQAGHRVVLPLQIVAHADEWPGVDTVMGLPVDIDASGWHSIVGSLTSSGTGAAEHLGHLAY